MHYLLVLILCLISAPIQGSPFLLDEFVNFDITNKSEAAVPNPIDLNPKWWDYFNSEGDELKKKIEISIEHLRDLYVKLPLEDQKQALALINKISTTLNALPFAITQENAELPNPPPFLKSYTLDKQLELHHYQRKINEEIEAEKERNELSKERIVKTQKFIDNLMVSYLGQTQPSTKKFIQGLEIMSYGASVGLAEHHLKAAIRNTNSLYEKLERLDEELKYSRQHLDLHDFDQIQLEKRMASLQKDFDKGQKELASVETQLLESLSNNSDRNQQFALEQQLLQARVNGAYTWTKLAFETFKYNLLMHMNNRFQEGNQTLRYDIATWLKKINDIKMQATKWHQTALREQDRVRQEYTTLIEQNEGSSSSLMKANQTQRQKVLNILTTLELLQHEVANTEWLIGLLEDYFKEQSHFVQNWWVSTRQLFTKMFTATSHAFNFSLFKVNGIPITLISIIKIMFICGLAFWISRVARKALKAFGKTRADFSDSSLHTLGGLVHYLFLFLGAVLSLCSIGFDFSSLMFVLGALLFGISFGLQSIANNFFSGLRILFEKKLKIGDEIELSTGHSGRVKEIHIQNTVVCTSDGQKVIIPNSEIIGNTLVNWTKNNHDYRRLHIPFSVSVNSDKELVRQVVIDAAKRVPSFLRDPDYGDPEVWLMKFDRFALHFELVVWVNYDHEAITSSKEADFLWEIETVLRDHQVAMPISFQELLQLKPT